MTMIIDATGAILGRLTAQVAKAALEGQNVVIVNSEKIVISGDPVMTVAKYKGRRGMQDKADPEKGPKWPKRPDYLYKRILRGMLPKHSARGKAALSRVKAYLGVPAEYAGKAKPFAFTSAQLTCRYISLQELCAKI